MRVAPCDICWQRVSFCHCALASRCPGVLEGKSVRSRDIAIRRYEDLGSVRECHILFVPGGEAKSLGVLRKLVAGKSVLLVGESNDFARNGGVVNFYLEEGKLRFEINPGAAEREKLKVSSKLLNLARGRGPGRQRQGGGAPLGGLRIRARPLQRGAGRLPEGPLK